MKNLVVLITLIFIVSCSGIKLLSSKDYYSNDFQKKIETIQSIYRDGLSSEAIKRLEAIDDSTLKDVEKAKKYNFLGVIQFSNDDTDKAITLFEKANTYQHDFLELKNQIRLNLASSFYKIEQFEYSKNYLRQIQVDTLKRAEGEKYAKLKLIVFQKFEKNEEVISAIFYLGRPLETFNDVKEFDYLSLLKSSYSKLSDSKKIYFLEENTENILAAYLAKEEAFRRMILGDKDGMTDIISWLESKFGHVEEVQKIVLDYNSNMKSYSKIDARSIGVILPLSDRNKSKFANKVLSGIESAVNYSKNKDFLATIHIKDSYNSPAVSAKVVRELILKHNVSVIIGGLYSNNARAQYLEARKYGALFISLSTVDLSKSEKSPLLIEIPGSIQSQIAALTDPKFLNYYGNNLAVLYPNNQKGNIYANELWSLNEEGQLNIKSINKFDTSTKDFRAPISKLLGLKYQRQREEELNLWKAIYEVKEKKTSARRKQFLRPVIDFDWIFIPTYPNIAVQTIPTFKWFDSKGLTFFGTPSWGSSSQLKKEQNSWGKVNYIGDDVKSYDMSFSKEFKMRNKKKLNLLAINGFDAMSIAVNLIQSSTFEDRGGFSSSIISRQNIQGKTGRWYLKDNLWLKEMSYLNIRKSGVSKLNLETLIQSKESN